MAAQGVLLTCFKGCQAACPQCEEKKYSPNITTGLHGGPQSSGVLRHLHIWGRGSHSQEAPSKHKHRKRRRETTHKEAVYFHH